jgi:hypothetical protein
MSEPEKSPFARLALFIACLAMTGTFLARVTISQQTCRSSRV